MSLRPLRFLHRSSAAPEPQPQPLQRSRTVAELVLSDDILSALSRRNDVLAEFPFMRITQPPQTPRGSCKKCNQSAAERTHVQIELQRIRQILAASGAEKKAILKNKLGAERIVMYYKTASGTVERLQF